MQSGHTSECMMSQHPVELPWYDALLNAIGVCVCHSDGPSLVPIVQDSTPEPFVNLAAPAEQHSTLPYLTELYFCGCLGMKKCE